VLVTWNSAAVIERALASLPAADQGTVIERVVLVDNASADDTVARARAVRPDLTVVQTGANLGYAAAVNRGTRAAGDAGAVLVLNPDIVLRPGCLAPLVAALDRPGVGIAVPRLVGPDGALAPSLRREPTLRTAAGEALLGGRRAGRVAGWGELVLDPARYDRPGVADWATGAALLVSRECSRAVGDWDESFLLYGEETDFCLRARDGGFATWLVPEATVEHRGGESKTSSFLWALLVANRLRLYRGRHGRAAAAVYRVLLLAGEGMRAVAGRATSRAAVRVLLRPSLRPSRLPS
jgi:N-acetylglucosaminyl-diphospho-decaprenol L-rhamnosyltransferase